MGKPGATESKPSSDGAATALTKSVEEACKSDGSTTLDKKQCGCDRATIIITIQRSNDATGATLGTFEVHTEGKPEMGTVTGHTLEPSRGNYERVAGRGEKDYPIPAQTYDGRVKTGSGKNGNVPDHANEAVEVEGVTGFSDILLHVGNSANDTEGCILLGSSADTKGETVGGSVAKNKEVLDYIAKVQKECGKSTTTIRVIVNDPAAAEAKPAESPPTKTKPAESQP